MTTPQILSIALLFGMMALFIWGRFRYDVTAILALLAALALGIVKPKEAFTGFSDDIVIIVGSALVISAAVQRSGVIESRARASGAKRVTRVRSQLLVLTASVGVASALVKNVGALAMLMPAAVPDGEEERRQPLGLPDADVVRVAARRADDAGRHVAQHHRQPGARGDDRPAVRHVRLFPDRLRPASSSG